MKKTGIMIVEDEFVTSEDIRTCLVSAGYDVPVIAVSGKEALAGARKAHPGLVLMDIRLAGSTDGIEAAVKIREFIDIPVVYLTAYSDEAVLERARLTEPFGYIVKPFERRELVSTIEMALYKHARMDERAARLKIIEEQNRVLKDKIKRLSSEGQAVRLGYGFSYDRANKNLHYFDKEVSLTKKEHRFIHLLAENLDHTVPFGRIESYVWDDTGVDENTFRIFLWRLRSKIGRELIKNTVGIGYRMERPQDSRDIF